MTSAEMRERIKEIIITVKYDEPIGLLFSMRELKSKFSRKLTYCGKRVDSMPLNSILSPKETRIGINMTSSAEPKLPFSINFAFDFILRLMVLLSIFTQPFGYLESIVFPFIYFTKNLIIYQYNLP